MASMVYYTFGVTDIWRLNAILHFFCRFSGRTEFEAMVRICNSVWQIVGDPKTIGEYHGTHEILLDQEMTIALK